MDGPEDVREAEVFVSVHHPHDRPYALVFSQRVMKPISVLFLPLMILTLIAALQHAPVLDYLLWGFPAATLVAFLWTAFKLRGEIAEVRILERSVALRSVHEVALRRHRQIRLIPLYDVRDYGGWLVVAAGDADYVIDRESWQEYDHLRKQLRDAVYSMR